MKYKEILGYLNFSSRHRSKILMDLTPSPLTAQFRVNCDENCLSIQTAEYGKCTPEIFFLKYHCTPEKGRGTLEFGCGSNLLKLLFCHSDDWMKNFRRNDQKFGISR